MQNVTVMLIKMFQNLLKNLKDYSLNIIYACLIFSAYIQVYFTNPLTVCFAIFFSALEHEAQ